MLPGILHPSSLAGPIYPPNGVAFNGTAYLARGGGLTGATAGKKGIFSCWVNFTGGDGSVMDIIRNDVGYLEIRKEASNIIGLYGNNSAPAEILHLQSSTTYTTGGGWHHILASWDLSVAFGKLYVDDVDVTSGTITLTNDNIAYGSGSNWAIGARPSDGALALNGQLADLYLNTVASLDITQASNRALFRSSGKPAFLGASGEFPTGTQSIMMMRNPAASFGTNSGSGGNFSVATSALSVATPGPNG